MVLCCGLCHTFYFGESNSRCPNCDAGIYWQTFQDESEENEQRAFNSEALSKVKYAIKTCDRKTLEEIFSLVQQKVNQ